MRSPLEGQLHGQREDGQPAVLQEPGVQAVREAVVSPDVFFSERALIEAAAEGKQITEAEVRVVVERLARTRRNFEEAIEQRNVALNLVYRALPLVAHAVDVPQRQADAKTWITEAQAMWASY